MRKVFILVAITGLFLFGCDSELMVENQNIAIEFNQQLHSRVIADIDGKSIELGDFSASDYVTSSGKSITNFNFKSKSSEQITNKIGTGTLYTFTGESPGLVKKISITTYDEFPSMLVYKIEYTNKSADDIVIDSWTNNKYQIKTGSSKEEVPFWSFQSGSYENRPDWVLAVNSGFKQENYMGMNASDYGGGTPVSDVWRKDVGVAVGHLEIVPKLVSLPVEMKDSNSASLAVDYATKQTLAKGETLTTFETFVLVHQGDFFASLDMYRKYMIKKGISIDAPLESAYEPVWCAWGYERNFKVSQILKTLPKVKELGFKWAVLDDGWQTAEGDWFLTKKKFPRGDKDMKKFVDTINSYDLKAKLWWAPMSVDPGTDLIKNHPEYLLLNEDGSKQKISWWNAYYLCPAYPAVQEFTKNQVKMIMETWGYAGLKIDGQHLNAAPPCYNPAHNHERPEESVEKVPEYFKVIYETALAINPDAVVEICPCGTAGSFFNIPFMNQPVSSDPTSSWQIRLKGKTYKALMGASAAYYGDHVELSDNKSDFASTVGIGGVVGTKFTWPVGAHQNRESGDVSLTPEKEKQWKKWVDIYLDKMLPKGNYLGHLYDIGFDLPETHAIQKGEGMYYAFYADEWDGEVELRGLENKSYKLIDYVNEKDYGTINGPIHKLNVEFSKSLLLEAIPE